MSSHIPLHGIRDGCLHIFFCIAFAPDVLIFFGIAFASDDFIFFGIAFETDAFIFFRMASITDVFIFSCIAVNLDVYEILLPTADLVITPVLDSHAEPNLCYEITVKRKYPECKCGAVVP
eukprot:4371652-Amphidinium_carterae.1